MTEFLLFVAVLLLIACLIIEVHRRRALMKIDALESDFESTTRRIRELQKYEVIENAETEAARLITEARERSITLTAEAETLNAQAKDESKTTLQEARSQAETTTASARNEATRIISQAEEQARTVAGDAIDAKNRADEFKQLARAMKNVIDGYGDEYLIPQRSILDDLADDFSHKESGRELKEARLRTKNLIKQGQAAECDYKETKRRDTAIHFVLDAFNGKVDSILTKVRHDNIGKLKQAINDANALVNKNGEAFKNARIQPGFLDARLQELHWAVATTELKRQEQEEQRLIKEAMREEERARREYEKAIREAEKEERLLQKALKQAREQLGTSSADERAKYEAQLQSLQEQLTEAELKNQRALSMAQQTRRGHVYIISNIGSFGDDVLKIGLTRRLEPMDRVKELGDASVPFGFDVHALIHVEDAPALEAELHRRFDHLRVNKVNLRKEFFNVTIAAVKEIAEQLGIEVHWTMTAEAREYRESLAYDENQQPN